MLSTEVEREVVWVAGAGAVGSGREEERESGIGGASACEGIGRRGGDGEGSEVRWRGRVRRR